MSLDAKPSIPSGATLPDVLQQDEDKSTPIVVNSVAEFIENVVKVNKADGTETFYRGHADKDWVLLPSIFRTPNGIANEHLLFRDMVAHEPQSFLECESALDYLVQMQHYGLPTRLLDVTTNPLVALYFACEEVQDDLSAGILAGLCAGSQVFHDMLHTAQSILESDPMAPIRLVNDLLCLAYTHAESNPSIDAKSLAKIMLQKVLKDKTEVTAVLGVTMIAQIHSLTIILAGAIAGAMAGTNAGVAAMAASLGAGLITIMPWISNTESTTSGVEVVFLDETTPVIISEFAVVLAAELGARAGAEEGTAARAKDGVVYLFSVPEAKVKHYDSDSISVLANLAKCKISGQCSASTSSVKDFNKQPDIARLCEQIKAEKPHFLPCIESETLSSLFFVKAKNGNQRITNQMGAFLLFGLGLNQRKEGDDAGGEACLTKGVHAEIPPEWIKVKFIVPKDKKKKILEELANLGITESYIYPGIEQYAKELKKRYKL
jgi:FRG domain protein